jgi:tRNA uridine 5-carboxymethylaminomethyl modification enzyme
VLPNPIDERLTPLGLKFGIIGAERAKMFAARTERLDALKQCLRELTLSSAAAIKQGLAVNADGKVRSAYELMGNSSIRFENLDRIWPELRNFDRITRELVEIDAGYAVYLQRQGADIDRLRKQEGLEIPVDLDIDAIVGLSNEMRSKLAESRPQTIAQAGRIEGMTPAALSLLLAHVQRKHGSLAA